MADNTRTITLPPLRSDALTSINDLVTRTIREAILGGKFRPGERLQQDRLATELQVSRQPVREALRRLQAEGLVVQLPQRWMAVQTFSAEAAEENYRLRSLLESEAARSAARLIRPAQIDKLEDLTRAMRAISTGKDNLSKVTDLNERFHRVVWESSHMPTLLRFLEQLWVGRTVFTPLFIPGRARRSVAEHEAIVKALKQHDAKAAGQTMHTHIARAAKEYFAGRPNGGRETGLLKVAARQ
ncbi:MAG TPA: GntR family transcriptional regulator [bacterium]|nr:GntR family transcriptional regulator [bacterium]